MSKCWVIGLVIAGCVMLSLLLTICVYPVYHVKTGVRMHHVPNLDYHDSTMINSALNFSEGFLRDVSVEVKLIRIFPDEYYARNRGGDATLVRVLELYVDDVIVGKNVPKVIYCIVSQKVTDDIKKYDTIIMGLQQVGVAGAYPLVNERTGEVERFGAMFVNTVGSVAVFTDGMIDDSIEELQGWKNLAYYCEEDSLNSSHILRNGLSLEEVKEAIIKLTEENPEYAGFRKAVSLGPVVHYEVHQAFEYVMDSTENSIFVCTGRELDGSGDWIFCFSRYIDGCPASEYVYINITQNKVVSQGVAYTKEELKTIQSLKSAITEIAPEKMEIPAEPAVEKGYKRVYCGYTARYSKVNGKIFCLVHIRWKDVSTEGKGEVLNANVGKSIAVLPSGEIREVQGKIQDFLNSL